MKKYTLSAFIGVCIFILSNIVHISIPLLGMGYETASIFYSVTGFLSLIAWILIALFFLQLYKNQK